MTPEEFTDLLKDALGLDRLVSVVLYGSAAADDYSSDYSDYNVLVVCNELGRGELDALAPLAVKWAECGNPPPLLFTRERLIKSSNVFPITFLDIKETHLILFGEDMLRSLPISQMNFRFQLEHELKGKLIQLRESYLLTGGNSPEVLALMLRSLSTFQVLLRATLRFYEVSLPKLKQQAVMQLQKHVSFDLSVFDLLHLIRDSGEEVADSEILELFPKYLMAIENVADMVNGLESRD